MAKLLYRLGLSSARRPWVAIVAWLLAMGAAVGLMLGFGINLSPNISIPDTPTAQVTDRLEKEFPDAAKGMGGIIITTDDEKPFTDSEKSEIADLLDEVAEVDGVDQILNPFDTEAQRAEAQQMITDGQASIDENEAKLDSGVDQIEAAQKELDAAQEELDAGREQLDAAKEQALASGLPEAAVEQQFAPQIAQLDEGQKEIDAGQKEIQTQQKALDDGRADLEDARVQVAAGQILNDTAAEYRMVNEDENTAEATLMFTVPDLDVDEDLRAEITAMLEDADLDNLTILPAEAISQTIPDILGPGEIAGLVIALVVLVVMLGTFITAGLPIVNALIGVAVPVAGAVALSSVIEMASITPVLGIMLGLAVGIDYALFIINRHRIQLKQGMDVRPSAALANGTSGNAVVFAGSTVVIALLALNVTGIPFLGLMGNVAAVTVISAVLVAVTLTPAMLSLVGMRALSKKERAALEATQQAELEAGNGNGKPAEEPVKKMSTTRAVLSTLVSIVVLGVIAIPATQLWLGLPDASSQDADSSAYKAYTITADEFGEGRNGPLVVTADVDSGLSDNELLQAQADVAEEIMDLGEVASVVPAGENDDSTVVMFQVIPEGGPNDPETKQLVTDLRDMGEVGDATNISVAGFTSGGIDVSDALADSLPLYLTLVVGLSLIIMIVVFRSLLVPLIATGGFILSVFAALGAVVAIYQWGWLGPVFNVHTPGPVLSFLPTLLIGILFGLAMDYQLFVSTGMREAYVQGTEARLAVAKGFRAGRSVVIAAALIMISVFGGFIFAGDPMIRPIGFGLAFGVLVDAFIVRLMLVPALMHMLGKSAWWLPKWLDKILPHADIEGSGLADLVGTDGRMSDGEDQTQEAESVTATSQSTEPQTVVAGTVGGQAVVDQVDDAAEGTESAGSKFPRGSVYDRYRSQQSGQQNDGQADEQSDGPEQR